MQTLAMSKQRRQDAAVELTLIVLYTIDKLMH